MRKPLFALSLALSTSFGVFQVADTVAAAPAANPLPSSAPHSSPASVPSPTLSSNPKLSSSPSSRAVSGAAIVRTALKYLGYHYSATGNSPSTGFSCIGFVSYVYRQNGIALPGDLADALAYAPRVSFSNLMPGDIMYFQNTVWNGLSHAAIYIGGGKFVHAEWYGKGVRITSFYNDPTDGNYWPAKYLTANRPWTGAAGGTVVSTSPTGPSTGATTPGTSTSTVVQTGPSAIVTATNGLNLRTKPSKTAALIEVLAQGTTVYILGKSHGWDKVELQDGTKGWVLAQWLSQGSSTSSAVTPGRSGSPQQNTTTHGTVTSTVSGLRVHASPSTSGKVIGSIAKGQTVTVLGSSHGWYKVRLPDGTIGWVSGSYVTKSGTSSTSKAGSPTNSSVTSTTTHKTTASYSHQITATVRLHSGPGLNAPVIGSVRVGGHVRILSTSHGWLRIQEKNGKTGWVSAAFVR